jgi:zinc D-Ala-D-Ala carboxypeptidase
MPKLTQHFSVEEMTFSETAVRHGLDNRPNTRIIQNLTELCEELLEPIRELAGGPINVTSGYRSAMVNSVVGGSLNSQHMSGEAADINCPLFNPQTLFNRIRNSDVNFDQLINEFGSWVHVSFVSGRKNKQEVLIARMVNGVPRYDQV